MVLEKAAPNDETVVIRAEIPEFLQDNYQAAPEANKIVNELSQLGFLAGIYNIDYTMNDENGEPVERIVRNNSATVISYVAKALELEDFIREYDITGAKTELEYDSAKGEVARNLELEIDPDTKKVRLPSPTSGNTTFTTISLNNFASLNTYVSHASGDRALEDIVRSSYKVLAGEKVPPTDYGLYRTGPDFVLVSKDHPIVTKDGSPIEEGLSTIKIKELAVSKEMKVKPELVVESVSIQDAIDVYNKALEGLTPEQLANFAGPEDLNRTILQLSINILAMKKEFNQMYSTADNLRKSLHGAEVDAEWAHDYYEKFIKKALLNYDGGKHAGWDEFQQMPQDTLKEALLKEAKLKVFSHVAAASDFEQTLRDLTVAKAIKDSGTLEPSTASTEQIVSIAETDGNPVEMLDPAKFAKEHETRSQLRQREFKTDLDRLEAIINSGAEITEELRKEILTILFALEDKSKEFKYHVPSSINLNTVSSSSPRKVDINKLTSDAVNQVHTNTLAKTSRYNNLKALHEMYTAIYRIEEHSHDRLTGLLNKREFYARAEEKLGQALLSGEKLTIVFGDVNDLNLANKGGRKFGDAQLQLIGKSIDDTVSQEELAGKYGGDELALLIKGNSQRGVEVVNQIARNISQDRIPKHAQAHPDFEAFNPNIGWGYVTIESTRAMFDRLVNMAFVEGEVQETGGPISSKEDSIRLKKIIDQFNANPSQINPEDPDYKFYVKELLNMAIKYADIGIDQNKAASKFQRLYDMLYIADPETNAPPLVAEDENPTPEELKSRLEQTSHGRWFLMRLAAAGKSLKNADLSVFSRARKIAREREAFYYFGAELVNKLINRAEEVNDQEGDTTSEIFAHLLEQYALEKVARETIRSLGDD